MLAVNNSKNPVHDAKSSMKYSKVGEEAGCCCNHPKNPGVREGGGAMLCSFSGELPSGCRVADKRSVFGWSPLGARCPDVWVRPPPVRGTNATY